MIQQKPQGQQIITDYFWNVYYSVNGGLQTAWEAWKIETLYSFEKSAVVKEKSVVDSGLDPFIQLESMRLTACLAVSDLAVPDLAVLRALHVIGVWSVLVDEISY